MLNISYIENPLQEDLDFIANGIDREAFEKRGLNKFKPFCFLVKNEGQKTVAGIHGILIYGAMHIDELYVEKEYRNLGYATALMKKSEDLAIEVGCGFITVNTMDFEARPFYEKLGYFVEYVFERYDKNSKLYALRKELTSVHTTP